MNDLITINYDSGQPTVSARDLHEKVGSTERFSAWFERQLQYGFEEGEDFIGCKTFNALAHQELQDYSLTVDMAKQICMVQKNERAKKIRQGLIDLEKAWNTPDQIMARALKMADQKIHSLQTDVKRMKPLADFGEALIKSETSVLVRELAKIITQSTGIKIGQNRLYDWFRDNKYIIKNGTEPYQFRVEQGLFERKANCTITHNTGNAETKYTTYVTPKGQAYFISKFKKEDKHNG